MIFLPFQIGKRQHLELGQWLRKRYDSLVSDRFSNNEMYVRSTDIERAIMSALSNMAGFYPPKSDDVWNDGLGTQWQPIPVHSQPEEEDEILAAKKKCPAYEEALKKLEHSEEFKKINHNLKTMYHQLTNFTGKKVDSLQNIQYLYSCLNIEEIYNKTLPDWTNNYYPSPMESLSALAFAMKTYTPELARLKTGPLLKEILQRFQDKSTSKLKPDRSLWIYSAHDTTVANLLNTLGLFKQMGYHNPPYRAAVLMEMWNKEGGNYIQVFYKNSSAEPLPLNIPACGQSCSLEKMFELYKDVLPGDWDRECSTSILNIKFENPEVQSSIAIVMIISMMLFVAMLVLVIAILYKRRYYLDDHWYYRIDGF